MNVTLIDVKSDLIMFIFGAQYASFYDGSSSNNYVRNVPIVGSYVALNPNTDIPFMSWLKYFST